jgi:hypothetical protein
MPELSRLFEHAAKTLAEDPRLNECVTVAAMVQAFFPGEEVARHSPECYLAGSIPPANCLSRCRATLAASHTPTWRRLSDKQPGGEQPGPDSGIPVRARPFLHLVQL